MNVKTGASFWQTKSMLLLVCAILILVTIPIVSALPPPIYTAELTSPSDISNVYNGDTVTIKLTGLSSGQTFQLNMTSSDLKTNGGSFNMTNYRMPFAMRSASTLLKAGNLDSRGLTLYAKGTTSTEVFQNNPTSPYTITDSHDIGQMTYSIISITGYPAAAGQAVSMDFSQQGIVKGTPSPDDPALLTFTISNTNSGNLRILVPGATVPLDKTLTLRGDRPVPLDGGDSTSGGSVSPNKNTVVVVPPVVAATVPGQVTQTLLTNQEGQTLQPYAIKTPSAGVVIKQGTKSLTSANTPLSSVTVTPRTATDVTAMTAGTAPAGGVFAVEGAAIECLPAGATFNQPVTITILLTNAQYQAALTKAGGNPANIVIQYFNPTTQTWTGITMNKPSGHVISGTTTHFTVFQVFVTNETAPDSTSAQTYGSLIQETPTTVSVPSVQATQAAKASPTTTPKSPFVSSIAVIAIVGLVGYFVVSRKQ